MLDTFGVLCNPAQVNLEKPIAVLSRFFHIKWKFTREAAMENFKEREGGYVTTAKEVVVVMSLLLFVYLLFVAPDSLIEVFGVSLLLSGLAFLFAMLPVVIGNGILNLMRRTFFTLLAFSIFCPPSSFNSTLLPVPTSPPRTSLAA